jgi:hypothetical protein
VKLRVLYMLGQEAARLAKGVEEAGHGTAAWNSADVGPGIYSDRSDAASTIDPVRPFSQTRKRMLIT